MRALADGLRERLLDKGADALDIPELLTVLLDGAGVVDLLPAALLRLVAGELPAIAVARPEELVMASGMTITGATVLAASFELGRRAVAAEPPSGLAGPSDIAALACRRLGGLRRERVLVIVCDAANRPMRSLVVSEGSLDRSLFPVREILNAVLRWDGRAFAIAHNHPGGDLEPGDADRQATERISGAARVVGLRFLGHVIVSGRRWAPVATQGSRTPG
jgi:DNA repair protein RadC